MKFSIKVSINIKYKLFMIECNDQNRYISNICKHCSVYTVGRGESLILSVEKTSLEYYFFHHFSIFHIHTFIYTFIYIYMYNARFYKLNH